MQELFFQLISLKRFVNTTVSVIFLQIQKMMAVKYLAILIIASLLVVVTPSVATQRYTESPTVSPAPPTAAGKVSAYTDSPTVSPAPSTATNKVSAYTDSPTVSPAPSTGVNKVNLFGSAPVVPKKEDDGNSIVDKNQEPPKKDKGKDPLATNPLKTSALASSGYARSVNNLRSGVLVVTVVLGCLFGLTF